MLLRSSDVSFPRGEARSLEADLRRRIRGEVRFDAGSRALYATDGSNYRHVPIGVVIPRHLDDVVAAVEVCRDHEAPVLARGGGTALAGQTANTAVVIDMSKYVNRIVALDPAAKRARVQPGVILDELRDAAEKHHLTFGPDPATHDHNCLGGMLGNNSCGVHSVMAGRTADNVESMEVLTYDGLRMWVGPTGEDELKRIIAEGGRRGEIYGELRAIRDQYAELIRSRYPDIPRRVSGYNLNQLLPENGFHVARALVGTEGTCVTILHADLRLVHSPPHRVLVVLGYPDVYTAAERIAEIRQYGPVGLEGLDQFLIDNLKRKHLHADDVELLPEGDGWLLVEMPGETPAEAEANAGRLIGALKKGKNPPDIRCHADPKRQSRVWEIRESGLGATAFVPGEADTWPGWEDSAVPPEKLGGYLREFHKLLDRYDYKGALYGHFGDGCVHTRISFDLRDEAGVEKWRRFLGDASDLVLRYGGSFSGEHGDGQQRAALLPKMYGDEIMEAMGRFKRAWDPGNRMNPGKVVNPYPIIEDLRLGAHWKPPKLKTQFQFPEDNGSFAHAALRCVGVGKCRHKGGGVMCPSFMVTHEEKHTTRGRAHMLFEMLKHEEIRGGWRDHNVHEALDLCLACKGCKKDCPVSVDMATYKAEFHHHYYKRRLRPREAYSLGLIYWWSRLASRAPRTVNFLTGTPGVSAFLKRLANIAPERTLPRFAHTTFRGWFQQRAPRNAGKPQVVLWPDTFNNHFHPDVAEAAVAVLEDAGYQVVIPRQSLCCGRPLYAWGMLNLAKKQLADSVRALNNQFPGVPVVGLEPACVSAFCDELLNLYPHSDAAKTVADRTYTLAGFLENVARYQPPRLNRKAMVHTHCHHHAIMGVEPDKQLLSKLGLEFQVLDSGCCGMAGSFGFEKEHYDVSVKAGERVLLPAVREAADHTLVITDGYSCREQIAQGTGRQAMHLAQVLHLALQQRDTADRGIHPHPSTL